MALRPLTRLTALLAVLGLVLAACGGGAGSTTTEAGEPGSTTGEATTTTPGTTESFRIGLVLPDLTNQTINDLYKGAQARADELGLELQEGGTSDSGPWLDACNAFVASGVDVLMYDTLDGDAHTSCIEDANAAGILVVCLLACTSGGTQDATIALDFFADGQIIGRWMAEQVGPGAKVAFVEGLPGDEAATAIGDGFVDGLAEGCPDCELVARQVGGPDRDTAFTAATNILTANPDLNGMYALSDDMSMGAFRALETAGLADQVTLAGHNGTCEALGSILRGELDFTQLLAGQPFGIAAVDTAVALMNGEEPGTLVVDPIAIDTEFALGVLDGSIEPPAGVDVKDRLELAQSGC
ncbi:MAG: sugar ABC transporter substrate-binding protein [Actinobacteria bacterium]|nr:sugar ABC transporter substrate-binding protein [Actinomycetota bacterium]